MLELAVLLRASCPADMRVLTGPLDVKLADDTVLIPDVLVARRADFDERCLPTAPLLAVEVLSPSTRRFDLMLKRLPVRRGRPCRGRRDVRRDTAVPG